MGMAWRGRRSLLGWRWPVAGRGGSFGTERQVLLLRRMSSTYEVRIYTGDQRGAGTNGNVFVSLAGATKRTAQHYLRGGSFKRNSMDRFVIESPSDLGEIESVEVGRDKVDDLDGWFLDRVEVNGTSFPCQTWLGKDANGRSGPLTQILSRYALPKFAESLRSTPPSSAELRLITSAYAIEHPDKTDAMRSVAADFGWAGEDAYFCSTEGKRNLSFGVADGVYQWREKGIDAGEYSRTLMTCAAEYARQKSGNDTPLEPLQLLKYAHSQVQAKGIEGSSTACILTLDRQDQVLKSALLGDSGFIVLGEWDSHNEPRLVFRSQPQEHFFGYPYQLGHQKHSDKPKDAELGKVSIREHDLIIVGSDGLFDNLSVQDMISIIQRVANDRSTDRQWPTKVNVAATQLGKAAFNNSLDRKMSTPYSEAASDEFQLVYRGGKPDDITAVVAFLRR